MKPLIIGIFFIFLNLGVDAQEPEYNPNPDTLKSSSAILNQLHVDQDARIDTLLKRHIEMNKRMNGTEGYRLEIFFSSALKARDEAMQVKTNFLKKYPDVPAYLIFTSPDFKVRVGDFRTRGEALFLKQRIRRDYPNAFLAKDIIQYPKLYTDKQSDE